MAEDTPVSDQTAEENTDDNAGINAGFGEATGDATQTPEIDKEDDAGEESEVTGEAKPEDKDDASEEGEAKDEAKGEGEEKKEPEGEAKEGADADDLSALDKAIAEGKKLSGEPDPAPSDKEPDKEPEKPAEDERDKRIAELEAKLAEKEQGEPEPELTIESVIEAVEDESERETLTKFLSDYPENATILNLLTGAIRSQAGDISASESVSEVKKQLESLSDHAAREALYDQITYGVKNAAGELVQGHSDARSIIYDPRLYEWVNNAGGHIQALYNAANNNAEHAITLISAFKEAVLKDTKTEVDKDQGSKLDAKDAIHSSTIRGNKRGAPSKKTTDDDSDIEAGFNEALG